MALSRAAIQGMRGALMVVVMMGCGASQEHSQLPEGEQSAAAAESVPDPAAVEAPSCVDAKDQPISCLSDGDCCAGFVCGKDPELSQRTSFCIYGG
jgi:hypothetical protein